MQKCHLRYSKLHRTSIPSSLKHGEHCRRRGRNNIRCGEYKWGYEMLSSGHDTSQCSHELMAATIAFSEHEEDRVKYQWGLGAYGTLWTTNSRWWSWWALVGAGITCLSREFSGSRTLGSKTHWVSNKTKKNVGREAVRRRVDKICEEDRKRRLTIKGPCYYEWIELSKNKFRQFLKLASGLARSLSG